MWKTTHRIRHLLVAVVKNMLKRSGFFYPARRGALIERPARAHRRKAMRCTRKRQALACVECLSRSARRRPSCSGYSKPGWRGSWFCPGGVCRSSNRSVHTPPYTCWRRHPTMPPPGSAQARKRGRATVERILVPAQAAPWRAKVPPQSGAPLPGCPSGLGGRRTERSSLVVVAQGVSNLPQPK